jgi:hypothetical protein
MRRTKCFRQRSRVAAILSLLVAKVDPMIEIVAGDDLPDLLFVIVNRAGCHIDRPASGRSDCRLDSLSALIVISRMRRPSADAGASVV